MNARSMLAVLAIAALAGCHRRVFEKERPGGEVMVTSTTVITNAEVPASAPAPSPSPAPTATATPAEPPRVDARDAGATEEPRTTAGTAAPAAPAPSPAPSPDEPKTDEAPYHHPSAADRIPWAGDSYEGR